MPMSWALGLVVRARRPREPRRPRGARERSAAVKPISRILFAYASPLRARLRRNDHSSSPGIAAGLKQPTRRLRAGRPQSPPYLVLLRAGFCLPPTLPPARCALTAPFHPYPPPPLRASARQAVRPAAGGVFSVPLSVRLPCPGVTRRTALWSSDFPPPGPLHVTRSPAPRG